MNASLTNNSKHCVRGFTFIELLIILAIIGMLSTIVLSSLNEARLKALIAKAQSELSALRSGMAALHEDTGLYPNAADSFCRAAPPADNEVNLASSTSGIVANGAGWSGWEGPYMSSAVDPWGTPYFLDEDYDCTVATEGCRETADAGISVLVSCGPDMDDSGSGGSCTYNDDNVVLRLCD